MSPFSCLLVLWAAPSVVCARIPASHRVLRKLDVAGFVGKIQSLQSERHNGPFDKIWGNSTEKRESTLACGPNPVVASSTRREHCPEECPLHVENRFNERVCDFSCVEATAQACMALDPKADVPDLERGFCRPCMVQGCSECMSDGTDRCKTCGAMHSRMSDGTCYNKYWWVWYAAFAVIGCLATLIIVWILDLCLRPVLNNPRLKHALHCRSRAKLRQPKFLHEDSAGDPEYARKNPSSRNLWPLSTNLCSTVVAGPGLVLSFRFQVFVLCWALIMGTGWLLLGLVVDEDLFRMGRRRYDSPRQQCMVIAWGFETQHELLWVKVAYLLGAYLLTFVGALVFGIFQLRAFQSMDAQHSTHKDFTVLVGGLVGLKGSERLEEELKIFFENHTGKKVEAVSVGWDMQENQEDLFGIIEEDLLSQVKQGDQSYAVDKVESSSGSDGEDFLDEDEEDNKGGGKKKHKHGFWQWVFRGTMANVEAAFLSRPVQKALTRGRARGIPKRYDISHRGKKQQEASRSRVGKSATSVSEFDNSFVGSSGARRAGEGSTTEANDDAKPEQQYSSEGAGAAPKAFARGYSSLSRDVSSAQQGSPEHVISVKDVIIGLKTSGKAFVVFETENIRDQVVAELRGKELRFRGLPLSVKAAHCEPDSVKWEHLTDPENPSNSLWSRMGIGLKWVLSGMLIWLTVFYMPFVVVSTNHSYNHGVEPSGTELFVFGMVVCIGNVIMYTVCSEATERMRFTYVRDHEVAYMLFYTTACMFNVCLDMVVTGVVAYYRLRGLDTRTYDGLTLDEVPTATKLLMTYGMQRELANNLLAYSFPGTFLVPFLIEPFAAVYIPYKIMVLLVRSHRSIDSGAAEVYLASIPFDLSRYADIHLNVILAASILMFPGGFNMLMFFGLAGSHVWIYVYDHFRVLRFSPSFQYVSMHVDWWAQWMFCIPAGIILSTLAFKYDQMVGFALTEQLFGKGYGSPESSNVGTLTLVVGAFFFHVIMHTILLLKVVPLFGITQEPVEDEIYEHVAQRLPCSWLTANPVGVLRSAYFYCHDNPLTYCLRGKEHLLQKNVMLGQYFADQVPEAEDYSGSFSWQTWRSHSGTLRSASSQNVTEKALDPGAGRASTVA